jgi:flagellar hook protein FlgE
MQIGSVDTIFSQGNLETTGLNTDVAIQGNSFFVARKGNQSYYTRSGNFQVDAAGMLVSPTNGFVIQGKVATNGVFSDAVTDIKLPFGQKTAAKATDSMKLAGNLDASVPIFDTTDPDGAAGPAVAGFNTDTRAVTANKNSWTETSITAYDSLGTKYDVKAYMWKTASNTWSWAVDPTNLVAAGVPAASITGSGSFTFAADGTLTNSTIQTIAFNPPGATPMSIAVDPGSGVDGITQYAATSTAVMRDQNGYTSGSLQNFSIDRTGTVTGSFTNGVNVPLAQISLADFNNPAGLLRIGDNMYQESSNSGGAVLGYALEGSQSTLTSGALEMSNVDLAQEFTSMIIAQRGFQANSKVITTSDEMLQELVNLKR